MRILRVIGIFFVFLFILSCSKGGPLTPSESFKIIQDAVNKNDYNTVLAHLSSGSMDKIDKFIKVTHELKDPQIIELARTSGISPEKLRNLKPIDCIGIYFSSNTVQMNLRNIINEKILAVDIDGGSAAVKTSAGFDLDFVREGPYWKLDISRL